MYTDTRIYVYRSVCSRAYYNFLSIHIFIVLDYFYVRYAKKVIVLERKSIIVVLQFNFFFFFLPWKTSITYERFMVKLDTNEFLIEMFLEIIVHDSTIFCIIDAFG